MGGWGEGGAGDAGPVGDGSLHDELDTRYRFAGGYGYESAGGAAGSPAGGYGAALLALPGAWGWGASGSGYCGANPNLPPITLQHLGWRWHQADSGRFVQRDPIGIRGGFNAYAYGHDRGPAIADPSGTNVVILEGGRWGHTGVAIEDPSRDGTWHYCDYFAEPDDFKYVGGPGKTTRKRIKMVPRGPRLPRTPEQDRAAINEVRRWQVVPPNYCVPFMVCHDLTATIVGIGESRPTIVETL